MNLKDNPKAVHAVEADQKAVHVEANPKAVHAVAIDQKAVHAVAIDQKAVHAVATDQKAVRDPVLVDADIEWFIKFLDDKIGQIEEKLSKIEQIII